MKLIDVKFLFIWISISFLGLLIFAFLHECSHGFGSQLDGVHVSAESIMLVMWVKDRVSQTFVWTFGLLPFIIWPIILATADKLDNLIRLNW